MTEWEMDGGPFTTVGEPDDSVVIDVRPACVQAINVLTPADCVKKYVVPRQSTPRASCDWQLLATEESKTNSKNSNIFNKLKEQYNTKQLQYNPNIKIKAALKRQVQWIEWRLKYNYSGVLQQ